MVTEMACEICRKNGSAELEPHETKDHREDWIALADPCDNCGAKSGDDCKPDCMDKIY